MIVSCFWFLNILGHENGASPVNDNWSFMRSPSDSYFGGFSDLLILFQDVWESYSSHVAKWLYSIVCIEYICEGSGQTDILYEKHLDCLCLISTIDKVIEICSQGIVTRESSSRKVPLHVANVAHQLFLAGRLKAWRGFLCPTFKKPQRYMCVLNLMTFLLENDISLWWNLLISCV